MKNEKSSTFKKERALEKSDVADRGCLLLVDDEDMIRRASGRLFKRMGYDVLLASNGLDALDIIDKKRDDISVIILDLRMPVMDGEKVFFEIKSLALSIPVIISSGDIHDEKIDDLLEAGAAGFIQKPFDLASISDKIADVVELT